MKATPKPQATPLAATQDPDQVPSTPQGPKGGRGVEIKATTPKKRG